MISILMPVKNAAAFLPECLESLQNQTYKNFELLAVDDGSIDGSYGVLLKYAAFDKRVKVFCHGGSGIIDALSYGFLRSRGSYIHRMDADDKMPPGKLEELLSLLQGSKDKTVATGKVSYFSSERVSSGYKRYENWLNSLEEPSDFYREIYRECVVASPNWLVRRKCFLEDILLENLSYPEDYDLVLKWHQKGYRFIASKKVTHLWREHLKRTSRRSDIYNQESFFRLKTKFFVEKQWDGQRPLQLIGATKKGRLLAKILFQMKIPFEWFHKDAAKLPSGFGVKDVSLVKAGQTSILAVWPLEARAQKQVAFFLRQKGLFFGRDVWLF